MNKDRQDRGEIVIYKASRDKIDLRVRLEKETVWLNAQQMAQIFGVNRPAIVKHVNNIYKTGELGKKSTCSILEQVAADGKLRKMNLYNLDMIISVGYRVNSKLATRFRIWATSILKDYLVKGYAVNQEMVLKEDRKFRELQRAVTFLQEKSKKELLKGQEGELLNLLSGYARTLTLLEEYDKGEIKSVKGRKAKFILTYEDCLEVIGKLKNELAARKEAGGLFGQERSRSFEGIIKGLYQTFGGKELYPTIEDKASHILYLIIKDHPFSDGNKRTGAFLFVYFLDRSGYLYRKNGERKINDNALTALALLVAESDPKDKDVLIKIILNLLKD